MKIGKIKADTPEAQIHVIPKGGKKPKIEIIVEINSTQKHNTRSSTKRVNHVTTLKNAPKMFPVVATEKINIHIGTD